VATPVVLVLINLNHNTYSDKVHAV